MKTGIWRRLVMVTLPLAASLLITGLAFMQIHTWERERLQASFTQMAEPFDDLLKSNLQGYLEVIEMLRDFHAASDYISREEFRAFVDGPLARHEGIAALSWIPHVRQTERSAFERRIAAALDRPAAQIFQRGPDGGFTDMPARDAYMPVEYVEPFKESLRAVGYDAFSDADRTRAIEAAIAARRPISTGPVQLVGSDAERSLLVFGPVFGSRAAPTRREQLLGCYAMVIQVDALVRDSMDPAWVRETWIEITDLTEPAVPRVLYRSAPAAGSAGPAPPSWESTLTIAGRVWRVRAVAAEAYLAAHRGWTSWLVLGGGLLFSGLLGGFLLLLSSRSGRAERLAGALAASNQELREHEAALQRAQALARSGHVVTAPDGGFESWSQTLETLLDRGHEQMPRSVCDWLALMHPEDRERVRRRVAEAQRSGTSADVEYRAQRGDGAWMVLRQVMEPLDPVEARSGGSRWFHSIQDVSEQKRSEASLRRLNRVHAMLSGISALVVRVQGRQELYREACRVAVEHGGFGMAWVGELDAASGDGRVAAWFGGAEGYAEKIRFSSRPEAPEAARPACVAAREQRIVVCNDVASDPALAELRDELLARGLRAIAALPLVVDGRVVAVLTLFASERDAFDADEILLLDGLTKDVAFALDHLAKADRLDVLACFDPLTGLPNRSLVQDRLRQAVAAAARDQEPLAVAFLDLDHFKGVNDSLGHEAGDELLRTVAQRLRDCVHEGDTVACLGSDEFVLLLFGPSLSEAAPERWISERMQRLTGAVGQPLVVGGRELRISCSIGVSVFPQDGQDAATLFRNADAAMHRAKEQGRGGFQFYTADMHGRVQSRMELESDLRAALERDELELHYQPQADLRSGRIIGLEALLRWRHPRLGLLAPGRFIGVAEESGLIAPLGEWVMARAAAQNKTWQDAGLPAVPVAVNVSGRQSAQGNLDEVAAAVLRATRLPPRYLELELTESVSMGDPETMVPLMHRLKALGVELSIDDFGTGYSSMSYLKRFPIDKLKLDMSFVREITSDPDSLAISEAIIGLAHNLRLRVIAEGVETEGQLRLLAARGCDEIQGYYFSPPLPAEAAAALLAENRRIPAELLGHGEGQGPAVLVLDDDQALHARVAAVLAGKELRLLHAENPAQAMELLACQEVAVLLCDQRMPGSSGTAVLGKVRQMYPRVRRVLMSAHDDFEMAREAINVGAVYRLLDKSWEPDQFVGVVMEAVGDYESSTA